MLKTDTNKFVMVKHEAGLLSCSWALTTHMNPAIRRVEVVAIESDRYNPIHRERILLILLVWYFDKFYSLSALVKLYGNHLEIVGEDVVRDRYGWWRWDTNSLDVAVMDQSTVLDEHSHCIWPEHSIQSYAGDCPSNSVDCLSLQGQVTTIYNGLFLANPTDKYGCHWHAYHLCHLVLQRLCQTDDCAYLWHSLSSGAWLVQNPWATSGLLVGDVSMCHYVFISTFI